MQIPSWLWIISGIVLSGFSGYIYKFVPKNGAPNTTMLFFFGIGIIFLIIGGVQLASAISRHTNERKAAKNVMNAAAMQKSAASLQKGQQNPQVMQQMQRQNRIEQEIEKKLAEVQQGSNQHTSMHHAQRQTQHHHQGAQHTTQTHHSAHTTQTHHTSAHKQTSHHAHATPHHHTAHIIACPQCGTQNYNHSFFCHMCGRRLR